MTSGCQIDICLAAKNRSRTLTICIPPYTLLPFLTAPSSLFLTTPPPHSSLHPPPHSSHICIQKVCLCPGITVTFVPSLICPQITGTYAHHALHHWDRCPSCSTSLGQVPIMLYITRTGAHHALHHWDRCPSCSTSLGQVPIMLYITGTGAHHALHH